ncbi:MAG: hemolysin family protein [Chloroflexota bacterium]|nr:hemolysin family protein [Chloroflexota bacterium]
MSGLEAVYLLLSLLFLVICAFFSSAEIGFIKLQRIKLKQMQEEQVPGADRVAKIMEQPERFLSTVLTGISFAETIVVSLGTLFVVALLGEGVGTPVAVVVIALLLLVFAKVVPKTYAAQHPERMSLLYVGSIEIIMKLLGPAISALSWITKTVARSSTMPKALISREEISALISIGEEEGVVDQHSARMLHSVVDLGERQVREIMTLRAEAIWVEDGMTMTDFLALYAQSPAQRYPVYKDNYDTVTGMIAIRDVLIALAQGSVKHQESVTGLVRPVYLIPETKTVGELFNDMRDEGYAMAVVVDEYGGCSGIVSIDQLIEEIVGEIEEDIVGVKTSIKKVGESTYKIHGSIRIDEVNEKLELNIPEGDYKTIGGFALNLFGHLPKEGEQTEYNGLRFVVSQIEGNKIARLIVVKERQQEGPESTMEQKSLAE